MNYQELAMKILEYVGGEENVSDVYHCATRLRFSLIDRSKAKPDRIEKLPGVSGVMTKNGQFHVIIGTDVPSVYRPISEKLDKAKSSIKKNEIKEKGDWKAKFIDTVSGIFSPTLPALAASGMLKVVLALLLTFGWLTQQSSTYQVINFMADATFYFYPVLIAFFAAKKFNCNQVLAVMLACALLHPNFVSMVANSQETKEAITVFGLPIYNATYSSTVIPIILGVALMSFVEPIADKISPKPVKFFTRPLITMFVTGIATLCVLGPLGSILSKYLANLMKGIDSVAPWIVPTIMGAIQPFTVITGTGGGFFTVAINNRMTIGYDSAFYPGWLASNVAVGAATLGFAARTKDKEMKQLASSTGITAVCGITEPALYGVNINRMRNMIACVVGGAAGGLFMGILGVKNFYGGAPGILTLPSYMSPDYPMANFVFACIGSVIAFVVSFAIAYIFYKSDDNKVNILKDKENNEEHLNITLNAPVNGKSVEISTVNDSTFANEIMGKGIAIIPEDGKVYSPANGKIVSVFPSKHAITIKTDDGVELLIHVGIDTVNLKGKYFESKVSDGQDVEAGDLLLIFDKDQIVKEGYDPTVVMFVTNSEKYDVIKNSLAEESITINNTVLELGWR